MKNLLLLLIFVAFGVVTANAQSVPVPIQFAKGASEKTITVTVKAGGINRYSVAVKKDQVINAEIAGDIQFSRSNEFPVISLNFDNGIDGVDNWQDGEGYLSILAGNSGKYIISVSNSDKKRARTFKLTVKVTNDRDDYLGGEDIN